MESILRRPLTVNFDVQQSHVFEFHTGCCLGAEVKTAAYFLQAQQVSLEMLSFRSVEISSADPHAAQLVAYFYGIISHLNRTCQQPRCFLVKPTFPFKSSIAWSSSFKSYKVFFVSIFMTFPEQSKINENSIKEILLRNVVNSAPGASETRLLRAITRAMLSENATASNLCLFNRLAGL